jgi:uncharacterized protein (DUF1697 family)
MEAAAVGPRHPRLCEDLAVIAMVALLRGVNVGGRTSLAMAQLREIAESCGFERVRTYIQSGNVVFASAEPDTDAVAEVLQAAIADQTSVSPDVMVRTREELATVVVENPFLARGDDPGHLHVVFTNGPAQPALGSLDLDSYAPEEAAAVGRQLYLLLPGGMGRSKLAAALGRHEGTSGTARNWRTVTKLLALADELA